MFSRVPQQVVGLVREKTRSSAVSRKDKSLGETVYQLSPRLFLFLVTIILEVPLNEKRMG